MYVTHVNRNGTTCLIGEMSDQHLVGHLMLQLGKLHALREVVTKPQNQEATQFERLLAGHKPINLENSAEAYRHIIDALYPYLAEAMLRSDKVEIQQVLPHLRAAMGRDGEMVPITKTALIELGYNADDDDDDVPF